MIARIAGAFAVAVLAVGVFTGCAGSGGPDSLPPVDEPLPVDIGGGTGEYPCDDVWPDQPFGNDPESISFLPEDWPLDPPGALRCSAAMTSDTTAVIQYLTDTPADEVAAYYEQQLAAYSPVVTDGIGGFPIVNGSDGAVEFGIQTDDEFGTIVIGLALIE